MKLPIPEPQSKTPMERLNWAFREVLKVSKVALLREMMKPLPRRISKTKGPA
jgi:hypothetical protein